MFLLVHAATAIGIATRADAQPPRVNGRISVGSDAIPGVTSGTQGNDDSFGYTNNQSADGRFVVFGSDATNLVPGDTNTFTDIFLRDRQTGQTSRLSLGMLGAQANGPSRFPTISADGRYVAFESGASNLVPGDSGTYNDIFLLDRNGGAITRLSAPAGGEANGASTYPSLARDGSAVAFVSAASNLVAGDTNTQRDAFIVTLSSHAIERLSVSSTGTQADGPTFSVQLDATGGLAVFASTATNLAAGDTQGGCDNNEDNKFPFGWVGLDFSADNRANCSDIFLRDRSSGQTSLVSLGKNGLQGLGHSGWPVISGTGRYVAFATFADLDQSGTRPLAFGRVYVVDRQRQGADRVARVEEFSASLPSISDDGRYIAYTLFTGFRVYIAKRYDTTNATNLRVYSLPLNPNFMASYPSAVTSSGAVAFESNWNIISTDTNNRFDVYVNSSTPTCTLTLSATSFEFGVNGGTGAIDITASSGDCAWGAAPDAGWIDVTSAEAFNGSGRVTFRVTSFSAARIGTLAIGGQAVTIRQNSPPGDPGTPGDPTVPRPYHRYLAEGATGSFFDYRLGILNPSTTTADVLLKFQRDDLVTITHAIQVPGLGRATVDPELIAGLESANFSLDAESSVDIVVDRTMRWGAGGYGAHAETAIDGPSSTWYLAEGSTSAFSLYYLLQNPQTFSVSVSIRYLRDGAPPFEKSYVLAAQSRLTLDVGAEAPELAQADISAAITASAPIIVERAMYANRPGQPFKVGHESMGVPAPATEWFFAEGATGSFFDLYILLANPNPAATDAEVKFLGTDGSVRTFTYALPANSRSTIFVDSLPELSDVAVSTLVRSLSATSILAERSMYWGGDFFHYQEAHNSAGATRSGTRWGLAEGEQADGASAVATYVLVANTSTYDGLAMVTLVRENADPVTREITLPATSRVSVNVAELFPEAVGQRFGVIVESTGGTPAQIVVERAMYWNANGILWSAGSNALATRLP